MSAEANLAGLYPPVQNQIWDSIKWMPIPVHTVPEKQDYLLRASENCPRYDYELEKVLTSPELEHINKANAKLYAYLTKNSGGKVYSLKEAEHLYDVLYIEVLSVLSCTVRSVKCTLLNTITAVNYGFNKSFYPSEFIQQNSTGMDKVGVSG